ncbi:MAG: 6,7-dimethyl-8-ribityllumazine synthase [Myxococcota bacterium]|nr:6,7-dimethyl-8-ribityllumazine synthase [Myxococcota bacterium]
MRHYEANLDATGLRFAVVVARFNHLVCVRLLEGCVRELEERGASADALDVAWVPGAYEIPHAARTLAESGRYDAVVTLGAVIRGGTPHFDFVCEGVTDGVREVVRDTDVPVAFGVLTTNDMDQAFERTGGVDGDKGAEVAVAAVEMARLREQLGRAPGASA